MRLLVLGGTQFLGRHLVEVALAAGHEITLFNRGRTNPDLFPGVERLRGDRLGDLSALGGRRWDVAIDTSAYVPRAVRASATLLADAVDRYHFVSTVSVYRDPQPEADENAPVETLADPGTERVSSETYGGLKVLCEQAAEEAMPGRVLQVRPGILVGPHDPTDRFTYWPRRIAEGGEVLAPGKPERPVQFLDARDLAEWMIRMAEIQGVGVINAVGPEQPLPMRDLLARCRQVTGSSATFTWVADDFLLRHGVVPWSGLPLWLPAEQNGIFELSNARALVTGLTFRPLEETITDTLEWDRSRPARERGSTRSIRSGSVQPQLDRRREAELLAEWRPT